MSAELLREAAALMRERAQAATPSPWQKRHGFPAYVSGLSVGVSINAVTGDVNATDADHIALWHPAVALAVADLLDAVQRADDALVPRLTEMGKQGHVFGYIEAVALARAYLGRDA